MSKEKEPTPEKKQSYMHHLRVFLENYFRGRHGFEENSEPTLKLKRKRKKSQENFPFKITHHKRKIIDQADWMAQGTLPSDILRRAESLETPSYEDELEKEIERMREEYPELKKIWPRPYFASNKLKRRKSHKRPQKNN